MASMGYFCQLCSMQLNGPAPYKDHLKGAKHLKKVATHGNLEALSEGGRPAAESAMDTDASAASVGSPTILAQNPLFPFVCKLCNVAMNCEAALVSHNTGKKHMKALYTEETMRQVSLYGTIFAGPVPEPAPNQTAMSPTAPASLPPQDQPMEHEDDVDLSCHYCGILLFKSIQYKLEHLETDAHCNKKMQVIGQLGGTLQE
ncbi:zinc finger RNA-binding protein-like [Amblyomma americanum]